MAFQSNCLYETVLIKGHSIIVHWVLNRNSLNCHKRPHFLGMSADTDGLQINKISYAEKLLQNYTGTIVSYICISITEYILMKNKQKYFGIITLIWSISLQYMITIKLGSNLLALGKMVPSSKVFKQGKAQFLSVFVYCRKLVFSPFLCGNAFWNVIIIFIWLYDRSFLVNNYHKYVGQFCVFWL